MKTGPPQKRSMRGFLGGLITRWAEDPRPPPPYKVKRFIKKNRSPILEPHNSHLTNPKLTPKSTPAFLHFPVRAASSSRYFTIVSLFRLIQRLQDVLPRTFHPRPSDQHHPPSRQRNRCACCLAGRRCCEAHNHLCTLQS